ncbi:AI-2E family transporter [Haloarchaeobius sp. DFWS5]|uniref:AI-2E family transporter n=1 Tax=Haloarchaeobius sp. DFWS5 TaxID=3446114 RepID=UPI003EC08968
MQLNRRIVLAVLVVLAGVLAWVTLSAVFATVFFALTVASVVSPVQRWFEDRGLPNYWAGVLTTAVTFLGVLAIFAPLAIILYARSDRLVELIRGLPAEFAVDAFGFSYSLEFDEVQLLAVNYLQSLGLSVAKATPDLIFKVTLFVMVLFSFLVAQDRVYSAGIAVVPPRYHDIANSLVERVNDTLFAIYVLQIATAVGTFIVALPVFWVLGYDYWVSMAVVAGVLQFLPIIGPSVLIAAVALWELSEGRIQSAALVAVVGSIFIGYLPDAVIRPRLAKMTADMPGSLYFVGFIGGLLSVGPVGVIAGPLVVAMFVETLELLAEDVNGADGDDPLTADPVDEAVDAATDAAEDVVDDATDTAEDVVDDTTDTIGDLIDEAEDDESHDRSDGRDRSDGASSSD